jgi:hypothetical protein
LAISILSICLNQNPFILKSNGRGNDLCVKILIVMQELIIPVKPQQTATTAEQVNNSKQMA